MIPLADATRNAGFNSTRKRLKLKTTVSVSTSMKFTENDVHNAPWGWINGKSIQTFYHTANERVGGGGKGLKFPLE